MTWRSFRRDDATLRGWDAGSGQPVVFQHGLGGDGAQTAEMFPDAPGLRRLTLECRAQGQSEAGDPARLSIASFTDDVLAFAVSRGVDRFVMGGISMGAAIALRLTVQHPARVRGLILARPAWLFEASPDNMACVREAAAALRNPDAAAGEAAFLASPTGKRLAIEAPDNLASLKKYFTLPDRPIVSALLGAIASDGPGVREAQVRAIAVPTLVIGHDVDAIHPFGLARTLAETIPGARLVRITPKATDKDRHVAEFHAAITDFLASLPPSQGTAP